MKRKLRYFLPFVAVFFMYSCGVEGDPGHCFFSLDWEYYNDDYGVYYYEDNNPGVPDSEDIIRGLYYDCYPGVYEYYYESEDPQYLYSYTGEYELIQNPGSRGGLFHDGADGVDTYFDLYLYVDSDLKKREGSGKDQVDGSKMLNSTLMSDKEDIHVEPVESWLREWTVSEGIWTVKFRETVKKYAK